MTPSRFLFGAVSLLTALLIQTTVVARLPLPGAAPDLMLVLVVAFAIVEGPLSGLVTGFVAGLLVDLLATHEVGRLALAFALAGYLTGMLRDDTERSVLLPFGAVALGGVVALGIYAAEGVLLGDARITWAATGLGLVTSVPYDVVLTPFVVPVVGALVRRLDLDPLRR